MLLVSCGQKSASNQNQLRKSQVIYGEDNRQKIDEESSDVIKQQAQAVAVLAYDYQLRDNPKDSQTVKYTKVPAFAPYDLCPDNRFAQEHTLSQCSGFLITDDILVTAGHCLSESIDCEFANWVFDYLNGDGIIEKKNIYECEQILSTGIYNDHYDDYTIIKLSRKATERQPLTLNLEDNLKRHTPLHMIGAPFGIPLKLADQAQVVQTQSNIESIALQSMYPAVPTEQVLLKKEYYFMANLDAFAGNSGSPVINSQTNKVEGIMSYGSEDWVFDEQSFCFRPKVLHDVPKNVEELIFKLSAIEELQDLVATPVKPEQL